MPVVSAGEVELSYERSSSGPPLLMIMGMSGTALSWGEPFLEPLRQDFETIVYDHRGVGESSPMEEPFTIAQLAEDAAGLLDALELDSAHVVGISMGGAVAQELALRHPDLVRALPLVSQALRAPAEIRSDPAVIAAYLGAVEEDGASQQAAPRSVTSL